MKSNQNNKSIRDNIKDIIIFIESVSNISFIECVILTLCLLGSVLIISSSFDVSWQGRTIAFVLTFITSWLMSKISSNRELKEEQKKFAAVSYRHSKNLAVKMDLSVEKYKCISAQKCEKQDSCVYFNNMDEIIEDILIFKNDTEENIEDISHHISEDVISLKKIEEIDNKIETLNSKLQDENYTEEFEKIEEELKQLDCEKNLEFKKIRKELQIHYMNRKLRDNDLKKIIKFRKDKIQSQADSQRIYSEVASEFSNEIRKRFSY